MNWRRALRLGLALAALWLLAAQLQQRWLRQQVLHADAADAQVLGRHVMVGYTDLEEVRLLAGRGLIGGVFVTHRNVVGKTLAQVRADISSLQAARRAGGWPELLVATDQEGGAVSRLSPPLALQPPLASLLGPQAGTETAKAGPGLAASSAAARRYGEAQGQGLAWLGVNLNFSPVVDLPGSAPPGWAAAWLDPYTRISQRAISQDAATTRTVALAYSEGLQSQGVRPTFKHFPGLGRVAADTHFFSAASPVPVAELRRQDWLPFIAGARSTQAFIMLAHVTLPELDAANPASFSKAVVQGVIRGEWRHDGPLITDDLNMAAAYRHGLCQASVKALNAGVDMLLISYDPSRFYPAMHCLAQARREHRLDLTLLAESAARLAR